MTRWRHVLTRNLGLKLLSLAGGATLWMYVSMQPEMERVVDIPVQYVNVPASLELNPDQVERVTVILAGPRDRLEELSPSTLPVAVDLSTVNTPGEHTFNVQDLRFGLPLGVRVIKAVPSQLRLLLEKQARRQVSVVPRFVGDYQAGYTLQSYAVDPPQLVIVGPESRMALVDQVTTDPIDLSGEIGTKNFQATAYLPDPYLRFEGGSTVTVEVNVRRRD